MLKSTEIIKDVDNKQYQRQKKEGGLPPVCGFTFQMAGNQGEQDIEQEGAFAGQSARLRRTCGLAFAAAAFGATRRPCVAGVAQMGGGWCAVIGRIRQRVAAGGRRSASAGCFYSNFVRYI